MEAWGRCKAVPTTTQKGMDMGNILVGELKIVGSRPLWQHRFGPDALPLEKQERTGVAGNDPYEWRRTCLVTNKGQLYIPGDYFFSCLKEAGKHTRSGRASIMTKVAATVQVTDDRALLDRYYPGWPCDAPFDPLTVDDCSTDPDELVYIDVRGVKNPATKSRNVRYRLATAPGWKATVHLMWDKTIVARAQMEAVAIDAGRLVGLGDGRGIGMGRFEVESFAISET